MLGMKKVFVEEPLIAGVFHLNSKFILKICSLYRDVKFSCNARLQFA